ncbi:DUF5654 family protein [Methanomicrobium antiquum]|uniref:DUF5654 family protein n=1 Tax=Methanomicrobium antiquum TaxID=487686 RepID=A0AAF0FYB6_9EURY|nr:DUF5654 family protein [Methanomicrobium antiquum]MDD3977066.1 DUF5654 family protein [Methanomicrobium sp.]WFN36904.1 DUF5654 family protein [Methanomicrobium antiquum]
MGLSIQIIEKIAALMTAAFGLVAALAWNSAIQAFFKEIFGDTSSLIAMFTYAIIVTVIAVIAAIWIGKLAEKVKEEEKAEENTV